MAIILTNNQKVSIDTLEVQLEEAYLNGVENPNTTPNILPIQGYNAMNAVGDPPQDVKPAIKSPFKSLIASLITSIEPYHEVSSFSSGWGNSGGAYTTAAYYIDPFGLVHLKGNVGGTFVNTTIFNLPLAYRPSKIHTFACASGITSGLIEVRPDGDIVSILTTTASLDGITYRVT